MKVLTINVVFNNEVACGGPLFEERLNMLLKNSFMSGFNLEVKNFSSVNESKGITGIEICPIVKQHIDIFRYVAQGLSAQEIANKDDVYVSHRTLESYIAKARSFYECQNTTSLVYFLTKNKILD